MVKAKLDPQEAALLRSYEAGEWHTIDDFDTEARTYAQYAHAAFKKDRRVNIRISSHDLERIQIRALELESRGGRQ
jgi:predicted DNA binding CopG/RHH family protein